MLELLKDSLTLIIIFPLIIIAGSYLSYRLRFVQITKLKQALLLITVKERAGGISSFGALSAVLGGNLGTGNISGVAVALVSGGPGALLWMWVMAILASITKYVGCFLGVHWQRQNKDGEWVGGPMYYLSEGLKSKKLALLFCFFTVLSAFTVGNLAQVHALSLPIKELHINPLLFGVILAVLVGGVIFGSLNRFSHIVSAIVPFMAVTYIVTCLIILFLHRHNILSSIALIIESAFDLGTAASGFVGYGIVHAIRAGFDRGLFATDSGLGLAPIMHAGVRDLSTHHDNRVSQGLISLLSPIIVMLVCTMTGLVLLTTGVTKLELSSTTMCMEAFRLGFGYAWAAHIVSITLFFFAFTTILTWYYCAKRAIEYSLGDKYLSLFRIIFIIFIPYGVFIHENIVWLIADLSINFMFIINMIGVIGLSALVIKNS
jgi:AGCS family alanine or glycine:cation symporter